MPGHPYEFGFDLRLISEKLLEPLSWAAPKTVFVNSMSDLFQVGIPDDYIVAVAQVMVRTGWHTYQVLTKRADRMRTLLDTKLRFAASAPNIWWGVSVEDRKYGLPRIDELRQAPATVRFLSIEPLLEGLGEIDFTRIHWAIVGGESGRGARPMEAAWVEAIRLQCQRAGIPFFFKQWGGTNKKQAGRTLNGQTYDDMPSRAVVEIPTRTERQRIIDGLVTAFGGWPPSRHVAQGNTLGA